MPRVAGDCICGHAEDVHFNDADGMIVDGACEAGRWTGVPCLCEWYSKKPLIKDVDHDRAA
jgi:hypothetical protein